MNEPAARLLGRPKNAEKRAAILDAASLLFLEQGFERTTLDAVAARAGVSKLTVYSHFQNKEGLFEALIASKCEQCFEAREFAELAPLGPRTALLRIANAFLSLMFQPDVLALHRVLIASATGEPGMNVTFWESGPAPTLAAFERLLQRWQAGGELRFDDTARAADQFFSMLKGSEHLRVLLHIGEAPDGAALHDMAEATVAMFLRAYAARSG